MDESVTFDPICLECRFVPRLENPSFETLAEIVHKQPLKIQTMDGTKPAGYPKEPQKEGYFALQKELGDTEGE